MDVVTTPAGVHLERLVTGAGEPVTVFAHGLAGDIASTRPLGSGVTGRRVFFHLRGHGGSDAPPGPWNLDDLADDLTAVADQAAATRAVGVSLGAAALLRTLVRRPDRFERLVVFLPAALDGPRRLVLREPDLPPEFRTRPEAEAYRHRLRTLPLADQQLRTVIGPTVADPGVLSAVTAPVLILGCHGDDMHPAAAARRLAEVFPRAELYLYPDPYPVWRHRDDLRRRISGFLNA
jgi:3-oxoadipate enol-lactonase